MALYSLVLLKYLTKWIIWLAWGEEENRLTVSTYWTDSTTEKIQGLFKKDMAANIQIYGGYWAGIKSRP
jgi:hypothetical protein